MNELCSTCKSPARDDVDCENGWIEVAPLADGYDSAMARCKQWAAHLASTSIASGMNGAGLDEARYAASWDDLELTERTWKAAREYGRNVSEYIAAGLNIVAYGPTGRGKTHAAVLICRDAVSAGYSVAKVSWADFLSSLRDTFNRKNSGEGEGMLTERQQMQRLIDADLTFLDDVGSADTDSGNRDTGKNFSRSRLEQIIDKRYNLGRPTIITSNFSARDLAQVIGERSADRVQGRVLELPFTGRAYRQATENKDAQALLARIWGATNPRSPIAKQSESSLNLGGNA